MYRRFAQEENVIWMSVQSGCEDAFTACTLAGTADTPCSPDGGPAVALWENDTLHKRLKQTLQAAQQLSGGLDVTMTVTHH